MKYLILMIFDFTRAYLGKKIYWLMNFIANFTVKIE